MKRRSIFSTVLAFLVGRKAISAASPKGEAAQRVRFQDRLYLTLIGTGVRPFVRCPWDRQVIPTVLEAGSTEEQCICALVGMSGEHVVHLYGDWQSLIPKETFLTVWRCNLTKNAVSPRLFVDGVEMIFFFRPNARREDHTSQGIRFSYLDRGWFYFPKPQGW